MTKFKTAEELEISQAEYDGLIKTMNLLKRKEVKLVDYRNTEESNVAIGFHMSVPTKTYECGTLCCIGGWVSTFMQGVEPDATGNFTIDTAVADSYVYRNEDHDFLGPLYYPHHIPSDVWNEISPKKAAKAIKNLLTTGDPNWEKVMEKEIEDYKEYSL